MLCLGVYTFTATYLPTPKGNKKALSEKLYPRILLKGHCSHKPQHDFRVPPAKPMIPGSPLTQ